MTYDPQQQRPEGQVSNSNRETLNIRQPGESANTGFDWGAVRAAREAAGRSAKSQDPSVGIKDVLLSIAAAPADIISGNAQLFKAGNQFLDDSLFLTTFPSWITMSVTISERCALSFSVSKSSEISAA